MKIFTGRVKSTESFNTTHLQKFLAKGFAAKLLIMVVLCFINGRSLGQSISMTTTSSNTQNFNSLATSGTNVAWTNNSTISAWYSNQATYNAGTGSASTGSLYSFGSAAVPTDRALGSVNSNGTGDIAYGVQLQNTSSQTITAITLAYTGEQWRRESPTSTDKLTFYYKVSASSISSIDALTVGWTSVSTLDFTGPQTGAAGALDGNAAANRSVISAVTIPSLSIPAGSFVVFKWVDPNASGNDLGLAIDDVAISWTVPSAPEINLKQGATSIATSGTFAFGNQVSGTSSSATTFTVENLGTATLNLTGTPKVAISGTNAAEFAIDETATAATVAGPGTTTFTITFSPTSQGSKTAAISIANDDANENPYVVNLTGTGTVSAASDIVNSGGYTYTSNVDYAAYQTASALTTLNSVGVNGITIRDGGVTTDADNLPTTLAALTFSTGGSTAIRTAALFDGSTNIQEVAVNGATSIAFTGLSVSTGTDGGSKNLELRVTYTSSVTDNQQVIFTVSSATALVSGSNFAAANAGGTASSSAGDDNRIEVFTTDLIFDQQPPVTLSVFTVMTPSPTVRAIDGNVNFDLDYGASVTMTVSTGTTTFDGSATTIVNFVGGTATFSNLVFNTAGTANKITATSGAFADESTAFDVTNPQPEINIKQNVTSILTGGTFAFGSQTSGTSSSVTTFTIENTGTAVLNLSGSPKIAISGTNAAEFTIDETATSATVAAPGTTTFTITFSPSSQGSKTAAISIANDDSNENPYVINLTGTATVSAASDILNTGGYTYTSNVDYAAFQTASVLTTGNSVGVNGLTIRDGGATTDADNLPTTLTALTFSTGGSTAIRTAALFDGSTNVSEVAVNGATSINFTGLSLSTVTDGGTKNLELRVTYRSTVTDNQQITFTVTAATALTSGSNFAAANAGGAASSIAGDINRIEVNITQLVFTQQPSNVNANAVMTPAVTLAARDANNNTDLDFTDNVRVASSGTMTGSPVSVAAVAGVATFSTLTHTAAGTGLTLLAERDNGGAWDLDVTSNNFTVTAVSSLSDYFRSAVTTGDWAAASSWESSVDGSTNWILATLAPNSSSNTITIRNGHTITINTPVTIDQVTVENGATVLIPSNAGTLNLNNGSGDDFTILNGGVLQVTGTASYASTIILATNANFNINTGGRITVGDGTGLGSTYNTFATLSSTSIIWNDGAIFDWNSTTTFGASGITFFPGVASGVAPILRISTNPGTPGGGSNTVINGKIEVNTAFTWAGAGTKTFRNGIIGSATMSQSTTGQFIINGTSAELGGSGSISLGTNGLTISAGTTSLSSNKAINSGTITVANTATLLTGTSKLTGTSGVTVASGGTLKVGSLSAGGAIADNIAGTVTLSTGSTVEYNGTAAQFMTARTFSNLVINNAAGVSMNTGSDVTVNSTLTLTSGNLNVGANTLSLNGPAIAGTVTNLVTSSSSSLSYGGSSVGITVPAHVSALNGLTVSNTNGIALNSSLVLGGTLAMTSGALTLGSNTLTLNGTVTGSGTLTGSASSNLVIGGTGALGTLNFNQGTDGTTNVLNSMTVNRTGTLSLGNKLVILDTYTPTAGVLTTGGFLNLRSTAAKTARVASNTSGSDYISGNVTIERYIPARRSWKLLTAPVRNGGSIWTNWQNSGTGDNTSTTGVNIWGPTGTNPAPNGATNGLNQGPNYSMKSYTVTTNSWTSVTNTTTAASLSSNAGTNNGGAADNKSYLLFATNPFDNLGTNILSSTSAAATTLKATGTLQQGSQTFNVGTYNATTNQYTLVGNPYASPVDFTQLITTGSNATAIEDRFWIFDATQATLGAYQLVYNSGGGAYLVVPAPYSGGSAAGDYVHLQSGQAVFVEPKAAGSGTLTFTESVKSSPTAPPPVFLVPPRGLSINLTNSNNQLLDGTLALFDNNYSSNIVSAEDVRKVYNDGPNVAIARDNNGYIVEARPEITSKDTSFLWVSNLQQNQAYTFSFKADRFDPSLTAWLEDAFTNGRTPVNLSGVVHDISFSTTSDPASRHFARFRIVYQSAAGPLPVSFTNVKAAKQNTAVKVEWTVSSEQNADHYEVEYSTDGTHFNLLTKTAATGNNNSTVNYSYLHTSPVSGINYYRIKLVEQSGNIKYSIIVKADLGSKGAPGIAVYPNPVISKQSALELRNLPAGTYEMAVYNAAGQLVSRSTISHSGGTASRQLPLAETAKGVYRLQLTGTDNSRYNTTITIQ